jgi:hypothetical protein
MHRLEAYNILAEHLAPFTEYGEGARRIASGQVDYFVVTGASGVEFRVRLQCYWVEKAFGRIRVVGTIEYTLGASPVELAQELILDPIANLPPEPPPPYGHSARQ